MDEPVTIGPQEGLHFRIQWDEPVARGNAAEATRGTLSAHLGPHTVWGEDASAQTGVPWTWVELLEHLGTSWPYLEWEESPPLPVDGPPDRLRLFAENRWDSLTPEQRDQEEELLWAFEHSHNLAAGLEGVWVSPLWLMRGGAACSIASGRLLRQTRPIHEVLGTLTDLGSAICARLGSLSDARALAAIAAWQNRRAVAPLARAAIVTGLTEAELTGLSGDEDPDEVLELSVEPDRNEVLAAARMLGGEVPLAVMRRAVDWIRSQPATPAAQLEKLTSFVRSGGWAAPSIPEEGKLLAARVREWIGNPKSRVEPVTILEEWGVAVGSEELEFRAVDAIACWGSRHGPAVLLNTSGRHAATEHGRRSTLAHEICHLVRDRSGALPLAEVFGGRVSAEVEARARAFAAELLIPGAIAAAAFAGDADTGKVLNALVKKYGASPEVVAWQARNSDELPLAEHHRLYLRQQVSAPDRF